MSTPWDNFKIAAKLGKPEKVPVALIVDSPWLPGYSKIDTRDYFLFPDKWLEINKGLLTRFPDVAWIPGFWVEYGMAAEPSAFGAKMHFHKNSPPSIEPVISDFNFWADNIKVINPQEDGFMPLVLRLYETMDERLRADGLGIKMVAARGPMAVLSWLTGISPLMMEMAMNPERVSKMLESVTTSLIRWLQAQLDAIHDPQGILLLDDIVGMVSQKHYEEIIHPHLRRIFDAFDSLIRIYHNDTPCGHLYESLAEANFDVFNFSHKIDIAEAKQKIGHRAALMGNVPPLDIGVRGTPEEVAQWTKNCLDKVGAEGGLIISFGGGVSPDTPEENIDALVNAVDDWSQNQ
jgi:uroporphyrinogen decarboxylase